MTAPLHKDCERLLDLIRETGRPRFEEVDPATARELYLGGRAVLQLPPPPVALVREVAAPGPAGAVPLRLYRGAGTSLYEMLPCLLFMHGGGWVVGDLDTHDHMCRSFANAADCAVLAVDYRLAPEHCFPAAVEDCAAALRHAREEADALGVDPGRIAVGGDSAGGNLAAVLALMGRDGTAPAPCFQMLLYPALDFGFTQESYARFAERLPLATPTMLWFRDHYRPAAEDWRASPLRAASLAGTAPAFVLTAGHDPLRDEGRAYAARLEAEGVAVTALHMADMLHGFLTMGRLIGAADLALRTAGLALRGALRGG